MHGMFPDAGDSILVIEESEGGAKDALDGG